MTKKKTETGPERMITKASASRAAAAVIADYKGMKTKLAIETRRLLRGYSSLTAEEIARRVTIARSTNLVEIVAAADFFAAADGIDAARSEERRDANAKGEVEPEVRQSMIESFAEIDAAAQADAVEEIVDATPLARALDAETVEPEKPEPSNFLSMLAKFDSEDPAAGIDAEEIAATEVARQKSAAEAARIAADAEFEAKKGSGRRAPKASAKLTIGEPTKIRIASKLGDAVGTLYPDGRVEAKSADGETFVGSPSHVVLKLFGESRNGWALWKTVDGNSIDALRENSRGYGGRDNTKAIAKLEAKVEKLSAKLVKVRLALLAATSDLAKIKPESDGLRISEEELDSNTTHDPALDSRREEEFATANGVDL